jgi:hypothetical protein
VDLQLPALEVEVVVVVSKDLLVEQVVMYTPEGMVELDRVQQTV